MPSKSISCLISGEMVVIGIICGAILLHSKQRLTFLNPILADLLISTDPNNCPWAIDLIPNRERRESVQKVNFLKILFVALFI